MIKLLNEQKLKNLKDKKQRISECKQTIFRTFKENLNLMTFYDFVN